MGSKLKTSTKPEKKLTSVLLRLAKSKTLDCFSIQLKGKVSKVLKQAFILKKEGNTLKIEVVSSTLIYKEILLQKKKRKPILKPIAFKKIRRGNEVYVNLQLTKEGELETSAILVQDLTP